MVIVKPWHSIQTAQGFEKGTHFILQGDVRGEERWEKVSHQVLKAEVPAKGERSHQGPERKPDFLK